MLEELFRDLCQLLVSERVINLSAIAELAAKAEQHVADAGGTPSPGAATAETTPAAGPAEPTPEQPQEGETPAA